MGLSGNVGRKPATKRRQPCAAESMHITICLLTTCGYICTPAMSAASTAELLKGATACAQVDYEMRSLLNE